MRLVRSPLLALIMLCLLSGAVPAQASLFAPEHFTLDNGMEVVVITNRRAPVVSHMVWYRVGSADEEPGLSGLAHFFEHLMFRGTETLEDGAFSRIVARNGGQQNAFTSWDYTAYYQNIARDRLELVMQLEADRMVNLDISPETVYTERDVILEERRQTLENRPAARLSEAMNHALYPNHRYGIPIIGWRHEIAALDIPQVQDFYQRWYAPNNAILVVAGDISADELRPLAEEIYGRIPRGRDFPPRQRPEIAEILTDYRVTLRDANVQQTQWQRRWLAPVETSAAGHEHALALQVLDQILSGDTGRFYRSLVMEQALASSAGFSYSAGRRDQGLVQVFATPRPEVEMPALEAAIEAEIIRLLEEGVTEDETRAARETLVDQSHFLRDGLMIPARIFGLALVLGESIEDVEDWPKRIAAVTREDVMDAAHFVFANRHHVTGVMLPAEVQP